VTKDLITDYGLNKVRQILGAGMPPVEPVITPYALTDGAYYQRRIVGPRIISLVCIAQGASLTALHTIRKTIINDIGSGASFVFKYSPNYGTVDELSINVRYAGGLEIGEQEAFSEELVIRLLATDPFWYGADGSPVALTVNETATACSAHRRASLDWSSMTAAGAPTGTVPAGGIAVSADGATVYVCQGSKLYRWVAGVWTSWTATGGGATVNCVVAAKTGSGCYVAGDWTAINGVAAANVASFDGTSTFAAMGAGSAVGPVTAIAITPSGRPIIGGNAGNRVELWDGTSAWASTYIGYSAGGTISALAVASEATVGLPVVWISTTGYVLQRAYNGSSAAPAIAPSAGNIYALAVDSVGVVWVGGNYTLSVTTYLAGWNGTSWVKPTGPINTVMALSVDSSGVLRAGVAQLPGVWRKIDGNVMVGDYGFRSASTVTAIGSASSADVQVVGQDTASASTWMYVGTLTNSGSAPEDITITLTVASGTTAPTLYTLGNLTTGIFVQFNGASTLIGPETITINTATNTITSSTRGSLKSEILNGVSISALKLAAGANSFGVLVYDPSSKVTATRTLLGFKYYSADALS